MNLLFRVSVLFFAVAAVGLADERPVEMSVDIRVIATGAQTRRVEADVFIKNIGKVDVTVPTSTYRGGLSGGPAVWAGRLILSYGIGPMWVGGRIVQPSPYRFAPVLLHPGESTVLPSFSADFDASKHGELEYAMVRYNVAYDFATRYGWWSGDLIIDAKCPAPDFSNLKESFLGEPSTEPAAEKPGAKAKPNALEPRREPNAGSDANQDGQSAGVGPKDVNLTTRPGG